MEICGDKIQQYNHFNVQRINGIDNTWVWFSNHE